jgi:hypothetical protein
LVDNGKECPSGRDASSIHGVWHELHTRNCRSAHLVSVVEEAIVVLLFGVDEAFVHVNVKSAADPTVRVLNMHVHV